MAIDITPTTILAPFEAEHQAVNLTRNTKGSRWNRIGNNKLIGVDQFRHNYNPLTGIYEGRALMGQWTNEIQDPLDLTTSNWDNIRTSINDDATDGIINQGNAQKIVEDSSSSATHFVEQSLDAGNLSENTYTVIAKASERDWIAMYDINGAKGRFFNVSNGTIGSDFVGAPDSSTIKELYNGWYECSISVTDDDTSGRIRVYLADSDGSHSYTGDGSSGVYIDYLGYFLNRTSPPPTPVYGETAGQSYTQDPDIATVTDLDAINFNPDEGTIVAEAFVNSEPKNGATIFSLNDGTSDNEMYLAFRDQQQQITGGIRNNGTFESSLNAGTVNYGSINRVAFGYKQNDWAVALNGNIIATGSPSVIPTVTRLQIGIGKTSPFYLDGYESMLSNTPRRLSNEQLIQETTI